LVCSTAAGTKTALDIIQLWFTYFAESFLRHLATYMLIIWKSPKSVRGRTKSPRGPHAGRAV